MVGVALGALAFALAGFLLGRVLANAMDIGGEGLKGLYICYGTGTCTGVLGAAIMTTLLEL
jgi:hypothetical protein